MTEHELISVQTCCTCYELEMDFIQSLERSGLITIVKEDGAGFISANQITDLEKLARLHYEMEINMQGLEAVWHLLEQLKSAHAENTSLRNRLRMFDREF
jgi:chaperone modulatory protein CbpM